MNHRPLLAATIFCLAAAPVLAQQSAAQKKDTTLAPPKNLKTKLPPGYTIPIVDISAEKERQVTVDREAGQYLGHPTTLLLEDNKTILIVYPKGHGRGAIVYKRSTDDGANWSELKPIGDFDGIVTMTTVIGLKTPGEYRAFFHDDGRFIRGGDMEKYRVKGPPTDHTSVAAKPWRFWVFTTHVSATKGDWVGWVGKYEDIVKGTEGQYRIRIMDNTKGTNCTYPGVELLPDGTFVTTTYGHWTEGEPADVVSVRFKLEELDAKAHQ